MTSAKQIQIDEPTCRHERMKAMRKRIWKRVQGETAVNFGFSSVSFLNGGFSSVSLYNGGKLAVSRHETSTLRVA